MSEDLGIPEGSAPRGADVAAVAVGDDSPALLLRRALGTIVGRGGILALSLGFAVAVARALPPSGRGQFALLQSLNGFAVVVGNLAISGAVIYHLGKRLITPERAASAAIMLAFASGAAIAAVMLPIALLLRSAVLPGLSFGLIATSIVLATPLIARDYCGGLMITMGRPRRYVLSHAAQPFGALVLLLVFLAVGRHGLTQVVISWASGVGLAGLVAIAMSLTLIQGPPRRSKGDLLKLARFGLRTYPAAVTRFLNLRLDQFLVRALSSAATLGQYAVAVTVGELLIQVPVAMLWALSGTISAADRARSDKLVAQYCRWALMILLLAAVVLAVVTPFALPVVFGDRYRPAVGSVLLLLPGMVCYGPALFITEYFIVQRGQPSRAAAIAGVSLFVSTVLNVPLTPALGAAGASIASSLSYAAMLITAVALFARSGSQRPRDVLLVTRADLATVRELLPTPGGPGRDGGTIEPPRT
jgi:O-antigen/teichoic acid export membrane protein